MRESSNGWLNDFNRDLLYLRTTSETDRKAQGTRFALLSKLPTRPASGVRACLIAAPARDARMLACFRGGRRWRSPT
jgi:hypothetical protein